MITDYESPEDELNIVMGIDESIIYIYENDAKPNDVFPIERGFLSIPCFKESFFWIELTEVDRYRPDKSAINMACKNFQLGSN